METNTKLCAVGNDNANDVGLSFTICVLTASGALNHVMAIFMGHNIAEGGVIATTACAEEINAAAVVVGIAHICNVGVDGEIKLS